ncbi:MAG TPA: GNAT family N-acetyltransferase, partial [Candidatus Sulfotelmatobacter sp.]|nr:GNAT family N-acetyltransferase [Candidatus Sulfotelmatobacter sp.]
FDVEVTIAPEAFDSPDARRLVAALDAHLASRYADEERHGPNLKSHHVAPGVGTFLVARADGRAVGCGAIRRLDPTTAEIKRMYVEPDLQGRGVGRQILEALEAVARELGTNRLVLETGIYQAEAIALYRKAGFKPVRCWGEYEATLTSVCFEKTI